MDLILMSSIIYLVGIVGFIGYYIGGKINDNRVANKLARSRHQLVAHANNTPNPNKENTNDSIV